LQAEGFVVMIPRRGAFVARPDAAAIADMFAVRGRLEPLAARLAAQQATAADVAELRSLLELARTATERADFSRVAELNSELHLAVIGISGNKWLASISSALYLHVHWVFRDRCRAPGAALLDRTHPAGGRDRARRRRLGRSRRDVARGRCGRCSAGQGGLTSS